MYDKKCKYQRITTENFRLFGHIIEYPDRNKASKTKNLFKIIVRQPKLGWRIAYLVVRDKQITKLEQHPESLESFEPVKGKGLLFVSTRKREAAVQCFLLDKPVILKRGIWHGVVALSPEFDIKITENSRVKCVYWKIKGVAKSQVKTKS
ncbi:MAG: ureidoglycolate lyase [Candidatus Omnitrophota bacterium]